MVKMRVLFISSVCIHGLLAFSIGQYVLSEKTKIPTSFPVILLSSTKKADAETVNSGSSQKFGYRKIKKVNSSKANYPVVQTVDAPEVIYSPDPVYPVNARNSGEEGIFSVKVLVNMAGKVEQVKVVAIKGKKKLFEEELLATLKTWEFKPREKEISFEIPILFQLEK